MKHLGLLGAVLALTVCSVNADIALSLNNYDTGILKRGETDVSIDTLLDAGSLVQIVWSLTAQGHQADNVDLSLKRAGEYVLSTFSAGIAGTFNSGSMTVHDDADVGAVDINSGYLWVRLWEHSGGYGEYFIESELMTPTLKEFDPISPLSVIQEEIFGNEAYVTDIGNFNLIGISDGTYNAASSIAALGTQAIPEPSTIGLIGLSSGILFLVRKKSRR